MVDNLTDYIMSMGQTGKERSGPVPFLNWTRDTVKDYVMFHIVQETLFSVRSCDNKVEGVLIAWQQDDTNMIPWAWQVTDVKGNTVWIDHFISRTSIIAIQLIDYMLSKWELWNCLRIAGIRQNHSKIYKPNAVRKLLIKAKVKYGIY